MNLKVSKAAIFIFVILLFAISQPVLAQEDDPLGPTYIVQSGDTLSSIALRFDIALAEIISVNEISDPNTLQVGDGIILPGIDWIAGTLILQEVGLGDSYIGLRRKYMLDEASFVLLNRITSPKQLFFGYSALLASERGENLESSRAVVGVGESLLEFSLANRENPWVLLSYNQLRGSWESLPGDVLFSPSSNAAGPSALPSQIRSVNIAGPGFVQGKTAVIQVEAGEGINLGGNLIGHDLKFFQENPNQWVALQGVSLNSREGSYSLILSGEVEGKAFSANQIVRVQSGNYDRETLTVDPELLNSEVSNAETARLREVMAEASSEKMWQGYWGAPHPYIDVINSEFGVERSFNQGSFFGFHYGVDFGGGVGIEIWAPEPGIVVFSELLEVRGYTTIIDHGWGIYSNYYHQSEIKVGVGDVVQEGQVIGLVGNTGRSSGAHLHWEIWANGEAVEPMDWINLIFP